MSMHNKNFRTGERVAVHVDGIEPLQGIIGGPSFRQGVEVYIVILDAEYVAPDGEHYLAIPMIETSIERAY